MLKDKTVFTMFDPETIIQKNLERANTYIV